MTKMTKNEFLDCLNQLDGGGLVITDPGLLAQSVEGLNETWDNEDIPPLATPSPGEMSRLGKALMDITRAVQEGDSMAILDAQQALQDEMLGAVVLNPSPSKELSPLRRMLERVHNHPQETRRTGKEGEER